MTDLHGPAASAEALSDPRRQLALPAVLMFTVAVVSVISSLGAPLIPTIARDLHASPGATQWSLTATLLVGAPGQEERVELTPDVVARVAPEARRLFHTGPDGARLLIIGGAPGQAYEAQEWSSTGDS